MVNAALLVKLWIVVPVVAGSSPILHPEEKPRDFRGFLYYNVLSKILKINMIIDLLPLILSTIVRNSKKSYQPCNYY